VEYQQRALSMVTVAVAVAISFVVLHIISHIIGVAADTVFVCYLEGKAPYDFCF
jgi:hypothetical protein